MPPCRLDAYDLGTGMTCSNRKRKPRIAKATRQMVTTLILTFILLVFCGNLFAVHAVTLSKHRPCTKALPKQERSEQGLFWKDSILAANSAMFHGTEKGQSGESELKQAVSTEASKAGSSPPTRSLVPIRPSVHANEHIHMRTGAVPVLPDSSHGSSQPAFVTLKAGSGGTGASGYTLPAATPNPYTYGQTPQFLPPYSTLNPFNPAAPFVSGATATQAVPAVLSSTSPAVATGASWGVAGGAAARGFPVYGTQAPMYFTPMNPLWPSNFFQDTVTADQQADEKWYGGGASGRG